MNRLKSTCLIFLIWTVFGLLFTSQTYLTHLYGPKQISWSDALWRWMLCGYVWAFLTPPILWLNRRFPFDRKGWKRALAIHFPASILFCVVGMLLYALVRQLPPASFKSFFVGALHIDLLIYGVIVGAGYAVDHYRNYREREIVASQLQTELARAQLGALKAQLHPHFLFNTLNTIAVLMDEDTKTARRMLVRLSDLLRMILQKERADEVSLREEIGLLESYLEIERMRFHDRLKVKMSIDPSALDACVPDLVLQPLVENAIKHAIVPRSGGGEIEVRVERENGRLRLEVRDDGPGLDGELAGSGSGVGLANTRARLEKLYGGDHAFEIRNRETSGLVVSLTIPFHRLP